MTNIVGDCLKLLDDRRLEIGLNKRSDIARANNRRQAGNRRGDESGDDRSRVGQSDNGPNAAGDTVGNTGRSRGEKEDYDTWPADIKRCAGGNGFCYKLSLADHSHHRPECEYGNVQPGLDGTVVRLCLIATAKYGYGSLRWIM